MNNYKNRSTLTFNLLLLLLLLLGALAGAYYSLRFGGYTMEVDASRQALSADAIIKTNRMENAYAYNNGLSYGTILAITSLVTGLAVQTVQLSSGVLIFILLMMAFISFRELLGSAIAGTAAVFILLLQPDFLFYIVRGSHERVTWMSALLMLFLLVRSQEKSFSLRQFFVYIALFYLSYWSMVMSNSYFASAFLMAIALGLLIGWAIERLIFRRNNRDYMPDAWMRRLLLITITCFILFYVFVSYTYKPAQAVFYYFDTLIDRISLLFFNVEPVKFPSTFEYFSTAWRSQTVYRLVTAVQWLISIGGFGTWLWSIFHINKLNLKQRLLWQLYTSFGILLALGLVADFAGWLNENLQMRMFTPFSLFSSAMIVQGLQMVWPSLHIGFKRFLVLLAGTLAALAFLGAQIKITNDPLIGNAWLFYTPSEIIAYEWTDAHMENQAIWVDSVDHLPHVFYFHQGYTEDMTNYYFNYPRPLEFPVILLSERVQLESARKGLIVPSPYSKLQVYDNGSTKIYRTRPMTPYQR